MPEVIMMVGVPCSGKSTYINEHIPDDYVLISSDDYIDEKAKELGKTYDEIFEQYIGEASKHINYLFDSSVKDRKNIVVDRTNMSRKARARFLSRVPDCYDKTAVVCEIKSHELFYRLEKRNQSGKSISNVIMYDMIKNYDEPVISEGFNKILKGTT